MMNSLFAITLCAVLAAAVSAQTVIQASGQQNLTTKDLGPTAHLDKRVASCLLLANLGEIELAKFAQENLDDGDVKKFAKKLVEDHQKLVKELERFAPQAASTKLSQSGNSASSEQQLLKQQQSAQQNGTNITPGFDHPSPSQQTVAQNPTDLKLFQIEKEAVQNCVAMTKDELQEQSGKHMEQAFVGCQIGSHIQMLAHLKAAEGAVSGELQQVIAKAKNKVQSHLDEAKKLMKEQEKS